jgi:hypothetical protein
MDGLPDDIWFLIASLLAYDGQHLLRLYATGGFLIRNTIHSRLKHLHIKYPNKLIVQRYLMIPNFVLKRCVALESLTLEGLPEEDVELKLLPNVKRLRLSAYNNTHYIFRSIFKHDGCGTKMCRVRLSAPELEHLDCSEEILILEGAPLPKLSTFCGSRLAIWSNLSPVKKFLVRDHVRMAKSSLCKLPRSLEHFEFQKGGLEGPLYATTFPPSLKTLIIPDSNHYIDNSVSFATDTPRILPTSLTDVYMNLCPTLLAQLFASPHLRYLRLHAGTTLNQPLPAQITKLRMNAQHLHDVLTQHKGLPSELFPQRLRELEIFREGHVEMSLPFVSFLPSSLTSLCVRFSICQTEHCLSKLPKGLLSLKLHYDRISNNNATLLQFTRLETLLIRVEWISEQPIQLPQSVRDLWLHSSTMINVSQHLSALPRDLKSFSYHGRTFGAQESRLPLMSLVSVLPHGLQFLNINFKPKHGEIVTSEFLLKLPPTLTSLHIVNAELLSYYLEYLPRSIVSCSLLICLNTTSNVSELKDDIRQSPPFLQLPCDSFLSREQP